MQIFTRAAVKAAYETSCQLWPTKPRDELVSEVGRQLCMEPETVEEALQPEELAE